MAIPAAKSGFTLEDLTKMGPDQIAQKRKLAEALLAQSQGIHQIRSPMEGMAQMAQALIGNLKGAYLDRKEREGKEGANSLFSAGMGMGEFPAAPGGGAQVAANDPYAGMADGSKGQEAYAPGDDYFSHIRSAESGGNDSAKNPNSSATGRYQFIGSTWDGLRRQHPELGLTADGRTDPAQQERAIRQFTADNAKVLSSAGIPLTGGNLYAAHFLGSGEASKVLRSDPSASVASIVGSDVVSANPFLRGMTVADFSRWAAKKGGSGPVNLGGGTAVAQAPSPVQVASLDPAIGIPNQAALGAALAEQGIDPNGPQAQAFAALQAPNQPGATAAINVPGVTDQVGAVPIPNATPLPAGVDPRTMMDPAAQVPIPAPPATGTPVAPVGQGQIPPNQVQLAQALTGGQPDIGLTMGATPHAPGAGPDMNTLMNMAGNEFMSPQQQKLIEALTGQRMEQAAKQSDPAYQMGLEKSRIELDRLKNPQMSPVEKAEYDLNVQKFGVEQADRIAKQADTDADNSRADQELDLKRKDLGLTTGIKDYNAYAKDEAYAGRQPMSRLEYEQAIRKSGAQNTSIDLSGGTGKQVFEEVGKSAEKAQSAVAGFNAIQEANTALDAGIISGSGADLRLGLQKLGAMFGADPTTIQNTETFRAAVAPQVAAMVKATTGTTNISNADREFAEKAAGGNIELDAGSIKRLMKIAEKASRATVERHRKILDKVYPETPDGKFDRERALFGVDALPEAAAPPTAGGESIDDIIKRNR